MSVKAPARPPHAGLLGWLASAGVAYELHEHPVSYTARETARLEHVDPHRFAKTVAVAGDGEKPVFIVVDAADLVDLSKARRILSARHIRLLTELELAEAVPSCDVGTVPPVPALFGVPMYADYALRDGETLTFQAGSHGWCVRVDRAAWEGATGVEYADLAEERNLRPRWSWS